MTGPTNNIREWWPLAGALVALTIATGYAVSRSSQAAEGIQKASDLGGSLSHAAAEVRDGTLAQEDVQRLTDRKRDLQQRLADARQPSLVQAELVKSAKEAGLTLREIQPIRSSAAGKKESDSLPQYRLTMQGTYPQMAEYLRQCTSQRLPARVVTFDLRPCGTGVSPVFVTGGTPVPQAARLTADITVEAFRPAAGTAKTQDTQ